MARRSNGEGSFYQQRINHGSIRLHTAEKRMEVHIAPVLLQELIKEPLVDLGRVFRSNSRRFACEAA